MEINIIPGDFRHQTFFTHEVLVDRYGKEGESGSGAFQQKGGHVRNLCLLDNFLQSLAQETPNVKLR
jgi:hypothetical protein